MNCKTRELTQMLYRYDIYDKNGSTICHLEIVSSEKPSRDWIVEQIKLTADSRKIATIAFIDTITETLAGEYFDSDAIDDDAIADIIVGCS